MVKNWKIKHYFILAGLVSYTIILSPIIVPLILLEMSLEKRMKRFNKATREALK